MNYFEFHLGDWARDTAHLTMTEQGAYTALIRRYYAQDGPLPYDDGLCCRLACARSDEERAAVCAVLAEFFPVCEDGMRHNKRADAEIERYRDKSGKARAAVEVRWAKQRYERNTDVSGSYDGRNTIPDSSNQTPDSNTQEPNTNVKSLPVPVQETAPEPDTVSAGVVAKPSRNGKPKAPAPTAEAWSAYLQAFESRYHRRPERNAADNAKMARFVATVGQDRAPEVVRFYLGCQDSYYRQRCHEVGALLRDAHPLLTRMETGVAIPSRNGTDPQLTLAEMAARNQAALDAAGMGE